MKHLLVLLLVVSCGKHDILTKVNEGVDNALRESSQVLGNVIDETGRKVDQVITTGNDIKNEILANTGNFTEDVGDGLDMIGQAPRKIANGLLGTNQDTDKELNETQQELADLRREVEDMYQDILERISFSSEEISDLRSDLSDLGNTVEQNQINIVAALDEEHTEVLRQINQLKAKDRRTLRKLRNLRSRLSNLRQTVRDFTRDLNRLDIFCETYVERFRGTPFISNVDVQCEIELNRPR